MSPRFRRPTRNLVERREILDAAGIARALRRMAHEIVERNGAGRAAAVPGRHAHRRGAPGRAPGGLLGRGGRRRAAACGAVDITLYRDDVFDGLPKPEIGPHRAARRRSTGATVVLVDDVLYTGRTIRAALDVLIDYGRPRAVQLAVLVDRGRRELPIQPDYVGRRGRDHARASRCG